MRDRSAQDRASSRAAWARPLAGKDGTPGGEHVRDGAAAARAPSAEAGLSVKAPSAATYQVHCWERGLHAWPRAGISGRVRVAIPTMPPSAPHRIAHRVRERRLGVDHRSPTQDEVVSPSE